MRKFQSLDKQSRSESDDTALATLHQNSISVTRVFEGDRSGARRVSTSGADGLLAIWDVQVSGGRAPGGVPAGGGGGR